MDTRTYYFLRNLLLNFRFNKDGIVINTERESDKYYNFKVRAGEKTIIFRIARTKRLDKPQNHTLTNLQSNRRHTVYCYYGMREESIAEALFCTQDAAAVSFDRDGGTNVRVGINFVDEVFHHLSAFEEYGRASKQKNRSSESYCDDKRKTEINEPLVDDLYILFVDVLNAILLKIGVGGFLQRKLNNTTICLTHDVDALSRNRYTSLRYLSFLTMNLVRKRNPRIARKICQYFKNNSDLYQIDNIIEIEETFGFRSTFFLYGKVYKKSISAHCTHRLIDPSYDISRSEIATRIQKAIDMSGIEVGLHCSYGAAVDDDAFGKEKALLEKCFSRPIISARNHFLNFSIVNTPLIQERAGIKCDATFYYNNVNGFIRHKTCSPFYMYSHAENKIVEVVEIPTVLMDSTLYNYFNHTDEKAHDETISILEKVRTRQGVVSINWHNETAAPEYQWYSSYVQALEWMRGNGIDGSTIKNIYSSLIERDRNDSPINERRY